MCMAGKSEPKAVQPPCMRISWEEDTNVLRAPTHDRDDITIYAYS